MASMSHAFAENDARLGTAEKLVAAERDDVALAGFLQRPMARQNRRRCRESEKRPLPVSK